MVNRRQRVSEGGSRTAEDVAAQLESELAAASPALREALDLMMPTLAAYERATDANQRTVRYRTSHQNVAAAARFISAVSSGE
jgi:hypothetical protein